MPTVREPAFVELLRDAECSPEEAQTFQRLWEEQKDLAMRTARRSSARALLAEMEQGRLPAVQEQRLSFLLSEAGCDEAETRFYRLQWRALMWSLERSRR